MVTNKIIATISGHSPDTQEQILLEALKIKSTESLYHFSKYILGFSDMNPRTHGDMVRTLEDDREKKLIVMPRGTFKSTIGCVAYPIWRLCKNPNLRILIDSEVFTNSKNFVREIKAHLEQPLITKLFGDFKSDSNWSENEITIKQRIEIKKESSVTASGIGAVKVGQHYDIIIADDLNSPNNSQTIEGRKKVIDHYKMNLAILEPHGTYVVIGTRYAEDDVIGHILYNEIKNKELLDYATNY